MTEEQQADMITMLRLEREENSRLRKDRARTDEDVRSAISLLHSEGVLPIDKANRVLETLGLAALVDWYTVTATTQGGEVALSVRIEAESFDHAREEFWKYAGVQVISARATLALDWSGPGERLTHRPVQQHMGTTGLADRFAESLTITVTRGEE